MPTSFENERIAERATEIIYNAVSRALQDPQNVYEDSERAFREGMDTAKIMLSKVSRGTRKKIEKDIINFHKKSYSVD